MQRHLRSPSVPTGPRDDSQSRGCARSHKTPAPLSAEVPRPPLSVPEAPLPRLPIGFQQPGGSSSDPRVPAHAHTSRTSAPRFLIAPCPGARRPLRAVAHGQRATEGQSIVRGVGRRPRDRSGRCPRWSRGWSFGAGRAELGRVRAAVIRAAPPSARSLRLQPSRRSPRRSCRCSRRHHLRGRRSREGPGNA